MRSILKKQWSLDQPFKNAVRIQTKRPDNWIYTDLLFQAQKRISEPGRVFNWLNLGGGRVWHNSIMNKARIAYNKADYKAVNTLLR
jgi:hypothetical protein